MDFEPHINAERESAIAKSRRSGFLLMDADNYPKIISVSLQLRLKTADQH
ncbi:MULTISPECIES: hypothetical protein [unclassified Nostoc]|nr:MULTISPECIES: hypothetical protein [unclassified Nostoc]